jgi:ParB/RepB/Spo0J family partition protein
MANGRVHDGKPRSDIRSGMPFRRIEGGGRVRVWAQAVPLAEIDGADARFQHRLFASGEDLVESIRAHGQRTPVHLAGDEPPYAVVDGFRRIEALRTLGKESVVAVVEQGAAEQELFAISFAENVRRRSYTTWDKAHAIWQAVQRWQLGKPEVAALLGLSVRQVDRYLALLSFGEALREAVADGRITMAHAVVLHRAAPSADVAKWIGEIVSSGLSAAELSQQVRRSPWRRDRNALSLVRDARGFRLKPIRYRSDASAAEKRRIWETLEAALRIVAETSERR